MTDSQTRRGSLEYLTEGYIIHWDERGLLVEVTDYDAAPLLLVWKDVHALSRMAGYRGDEPQRPGPARRPAKRQAKRRPSRRTTPEV